MGSERTNKETVLARSYQHFNNGGIHMSLIRHDSIPEDQGEDWYTTLWLETELRNMGSAATSRIQVFATTLKILAHFSAEIGKLVDVIDPNYLRSIDADITLSDGRELRYRGPNEDGTRTGITEVDKVNDDAERAASGSIGCEDGDDADQEDGDVVDPDTDFDDDHPAYENDNESPGDIPLSIYPTVASEGKPAFMLKIGKDEGSPTVFLRALSLADLINLEGAAAKARLDYEVGDAPKSLGLPHWQQNKSEE
jgi:hypothetical protein